tara:strand:+ start:425 stop:715 length:291 start_codon:yes stop_codon:yes gene_type:complete
MMGLMYDELYSLTPRSFNNKLKGFQEHQSQLSQNAWEQTRTMMVAILMPHSKKKLKATEILPFPWDNKNKPKKDLASKEHIQKVLEKYDKTKFNKI